MSFDPVRKLRGMGEDNSQMDVKEIEYLRFCFDSKFNVEENKTPLAENEETLSRNETPLTRSERRKSIYTNLKRKKKRRGSFKNMFKRRGSVTSRRSSDTSQESNPSTVKIKYNLPLP